MPELILIFVVALLLFGPRKMPQIGRSIGRALGEFRRASNEFKRTIEDEVAADEIREVEQDLKEIRQVGQDIVQAGDLKNLALGDSAEKPDVADSSSGNDRESQAHNKDEGEDRTDAGDGQAGRDAP
jgi:TatA/E family protein of Tat protein translocase